MPQNPARRHRATSLVNSLLALAIASTLALLGVAPSPAYAHAGLVSSTPTAGASLDVLPPEVSLRFSEEISEPAYVAVRTADGTTYEDGAAVVDGATVTQALVAGEQAGTYTIAYRVVSEDGHVVTGEFDVTVTDGVTQAPPTGGTDAAAASGTESGTGVAPYALAGALALLVVVVSVVALRRKCTS